MTAASSNIEFSDENAVAKQDTTAGKRRQQTGRPPALVVRLPGAVEHMAERRDRDRARWLGGTFDRPATPSERAFLAARGALSDPSARTALLTRVEVRGGVRRRTWPMLDGAV
jgi:hypothetical protein